MLFIAVTLKNVAKKQGCNVYSPLYLLLYRSVTETRTELRRYKRLADFFNLFFSADFTARLIAYRATRFACRLTSASAFAASGYGSLLCYCYGFNSVHCCCLQ